jgi:hypothetical protein
MGAVRLTDPFQPDFGHPAKPLRPNGQPFFAKLANWRAAVNQTDLNIALSTLHCLQFRRFLQGMVGGFDKMVDK